MEWEGACLECHECLDERNFSDPEVLAAMQDPRGYGGLQDVAQNLQICKNIRVTQRL